MSIQFPAGSDHKMHHQYMISDEAISGANSYELPQFLDKYETQYYRIAQLLSGVIARSCELRDNSAESRSEFLDKCRNFRFNWEYILTRLSNRGIETTQINDYLQKLSAIILALILDELKQLVEFDDIQNVSSEQYYEWPLEVQDMVDMISETDADRNLKAYSRIQEFLAGLIDDESTMVTIFEETNENIVLQSAQITEEDADGDIAPKVDRFAYAEELLMSIINILNTGETNYAAEYTIQNILQTGSSRDDTALPELSAGEMIRVEGNKATLSWLALSERLSGYFPADATDLGLSNTSLYNFPDSLVVETGIPQIDPEFYICTIIELQLALAMNLRRYVNSYIEIYSLEDPEIIEEVEVKEVLFIAKRILAEIEQDMYAQFRQSEQTKVIIRNSNNSELEIEIL